MQVPLISAEYVVVGIDTRLVDGVIRSFSLDTKPRSMKLPVLPVSIRARACLPLTFTWVMDLANAVELSRGAEYVMHNAGSALRPSTEKDAEVFVVAVVCAGADLQTFA